MNQEGNNQDFKGSNSQNYRPIPPKTWLAESILVTIFCCLPFGIVGIVKAANVESSFYAGRVEEAEAASRSARKWVTIAFWIGIARLSIGIIAWIIMLAFGVAGGIFNAFEVY